MLLVAGLIAASTAVATPSTRCPNGDRPSFAQAMPLTSVRTDLVVDGDTARLGFRLTFHHLGGGPGVASVSLPRAGDVALGEDISVTAAQFADGVKTTLKDANDAVDEFESFVAALEGGVDDVDVRAGSERRALLVSHIADGYEVRVAAACSVGDVEVLVIGGATSSPRTGGQRFALPRFDAALPVPATYVVQAEGHDVWIDGIRTTHHVPPRRFGDDVVEARRHLTVDVHPHTVAGEQGPRFAGMQRTYAPRAPPATKDDDGEANPDTSAPFSLVEATYRLPARLSQPVENMRTVFVVDASISAAEQLPESLTLLRQMLNKMPDDAGWALVAIGREPTLVVPPWRDRDDAFIPTIPVGNGSDVDSALALAGRIASDSLPGAGRVVLISDLRQATGARPLAHAVDGVATRSGTTPVLHIVELRFGQSLLDGLHFVRADGDEHPLAAHVERSGGVLVEPVSVSREPSHPSSDSGLASYLVRPTQLDSVQLILEPAPGRRCGDLEDTGSGRGVVDLKVKHVDVTGALIENLTHVPAVMVEGETVQLAARVDPCLRVVGITAKQWSTKITTAMSVARGMEATLLAGRAINVSHVDDLDDDAIRGVALEHHLVSKVTSLVATPTWRPAIPDGLGGRGYGCSCSCGATCGCRGAGSIGCGIGGTKTLQAQSIIDAIAEAAAKRCQSAVHFEVETEHLEVLAVKVREGGRCVEEHLWGVRLDARNPGDGSFMRRNTLIGRAPTPLASEDLDSDDNDDNDDTDDLDDTDNGDDDET